MKKLIFSFLLTLISPIFLHSQSLERQQKQSVRDFGTYSPSSGGFSPSTSQRNNFNNNEFSQKYSAREQNRQYYNRNNNRNVIIDPYWNSWGWGWGMNDWYWGMYRWNAPFGWNNYQSFVWYDNWGYRNPGRVYVYENGKKDTVKIKPLHGSFGVTYSQVPELGGWFTLGREIYLIADYSESFQPDYSMYYPLLTLDKVIPWGDSKLNDQLNTRVFSIGAGKMFSKRLGLNVQFSFVKEQKKFKYFDETFILSNNGEYTFPNYSRNFQTIKLGGIYNFSTSFNSKIDYDLERKLWSFGLGVRF